MSISLCFSCTWQSERSAGGGCTLPQMKLQGADVSVSARNGIAPSFFGTTQKRTAQLTYFSARRLWPPPSLDAQQLPGMTRGTASWLDNSNSSSVRNWIIGFWVSRGRPRAAQAASRIMSKRPHSAMAIPTSGLNSMTYFDQLCVAALENILRCSAECRRGEFVHNTKNAKLLYDVSHPDHHLRITGCFYCIVMNESRRFF